MAKSTLPVRDGNGNHGNGERHRSSGVMGGPDGSNGGRTGSGEAFDGLLVRWDPTTTDQERATARGSLKLNLRREIHTGAMKSSRSGVLEWVDLPADLSAQQAIDNLRRRPGVAFAEKNWKLEAQDISNDPYIANGSTWGLYGPTTNPSNTYGSRAMEAWAAGQTGSSDVYVGIIDEGYQYTHADLNTNAGTNPGEIADNGIDDDGNSYIDDVYGWDFDANDNSVYDGTADDHGTHVSGTIGGKGGNGSGVAGINWNVKLLNAKFLGSNGGTIANAIKAVDYFTALKKKGVNIVATNNSWGGGGYSQALYEAIERANAADILFVAAAGNGGTDGIGDNNDSVANYPSNYSNSNVIAVAAITNSGGRASFSNYGATTVHLGAPGQAILSTIPDNSYASYSGTSMATPHVTGAAALLKSVYPNATAALIKRALLEGTAPTSSLAGLTLSGGRLDIPAAITRLGQLLGSSSPTLPEVSLSVIDASASEPGTDSGLFRLTRTGPDTSTSLIVNLQWQGTASNGSDYSLQTSTATIPVGSLSVDLTIKPLDDLVIEGTETVIPALAAGTGYRISATAGSATLSITDNDTAPSNPEIWGTLANDNLIGGSADNIIGGVTKSGTDNGKGTVDTLTGSSGKDTFVLADTSRGNFYNDAIKTNQGFGDYALITDLKTAEGDRIQLRKGSQYMIRNNGSTTELFLGDGNKTFGSSDEFIARLQGVNFASGSGVYVLGTTSIWTTFV